MYIIAETFYSMKYILRLDAARVDSSHAMAELSFPPVRATLIEWLSESYDAIYADPRLCVEVFRYDVSWDVSDSQTGGPLVGMCTRDAKPLVVLAKTRSRKRARVEPDPPPALLDNQAPRSGDHGPEGD